MGTATERETRDGLVQAGYLMAFLLPIGGMVAAVVVAPYRPGHALSIATLSVVTFWASLGLALFLLAAT